MARQENEGEKQSAPSKPALAYSRTSAWQELASPARQDVLAYAEEYKAFLGQAKTERACVRYLENLLGRLGFKPLAQSERLQPGDKVYKSVKHRALIAAVVGDPEMPWRLVGAHIDSPRLDLKPHPLVEEADLALFKTHYYGGIKKYQWVNVPLSMHAVITTAKGKQEFVIGEAQGEPQFLIPDIAPHLGREQMKEVAKDVVKGEQLRIVVGNIPLAEGEEKEKIKTAVLTILHDRFGLVEKNLLTADITFVPAAKPVDIGLDHSMIAAYGQDDRICAFALATALTKVIKPAGMALGLFIDKEEIGSTGDTGAQSRLLENFVDELRQKCGAKRSTGLILESAAAISADVTEAFNPNFEDVSDKDNSSRLGGGIAVEKYSGAGGKYDTNEASSEYMSWLTQLLEDNGVKWQTGEMGKLDMGGGGTIAMFLSRYGMDAIDAGPPLLSMHATLELSSKVDLMQAERCYEVFLNS